MEHRTLAKHFGCEITQLELDVVMKWGSKVRRNEEAAMRLVQQHAPSVPIPHLYTSWYGPDQHGNQVGQLSISFVPGKRLEFVWDSLNNAAKELVLPPHLEPHRPDPRDPLLRGCTHPTPPLPSDAAVRERIFDEYAKCNGLSYADGKDLPNMLPRSDKSPDYWEYANLMQPSGDSDWKAWMARTRPEPWDITGINKARRVLFFDITALPTS
ncbi:hypothetical protein C7999DRAFT_44690 [Corynascus novoguineensis]|uniref:Uncharacterized protein n=1 Tax=Corynascus novoguineensis TaxID=1126955 RepID=A0AAN7HFM7_9PEZI|nr:hypothetical protein C7999DRAFT_44690 [Corynascus novoguineensis]